MFIVPCQKCRLKVMPKPDGTCPACGTPLSEPRGTPAEASAGAEPAVDAPPGVKAPPEEVLKPAQAGQTGKGSPLILVVIVLAILSLAFCGFGLFHEVGFKLAVASDPKASTGLAYHFGHQLGVFLFAAAFSGGSLAAFATLFRTEVAGLDGPRTGTAMLFLALALAVLSLLASLSLPVLALL